MNETLKKYKEYIQLVVFLIPLVYAIFKYSIDFVEVPDEVKELRREVQLIKEKNRYQDSVNVIQSQFLDQDYKALVKAGIIK